MKNNKLVSKIIDCILNILIVLFAIFLLISMYNFFQVKVLGNIDASASDKMTAKICEILKAQLDIPGNAIYVSYFGTSNWGWNGGNF